METSEDYGFVAILEGDTVTLCDSMGGGVTFDADDPGLADEIANYIRCMAYAYAEGMVEGLGLEGAAES